MIATSSSYSIGSFFALATHAEVKRIEEIFWIDGKRRAKIHASYFNNRQIKQIHVTNLPLKKISAFKSWKLYLTSLSAEETSCSSLQQICKITATSNRWRCGMKSYCELKAEMEVSQQHMVEVKKSDRANALKEVKHLYNEFGFTAGLLKAWWECNK